MPKYNVKQVILTYDTAEELVFRQSTVNISKNY